VSLDAEGKLVADRVRAAPGRKRAGARRPARKKRRLGFIALALLAALILGFLARRVMIPSAVHYIAYRPPDQPQSMREANQPATSQQDSGGDRSAGSVKSNSAAHGGSEQLTPRDRSELDAIIKRKAK
jgi:hypothetical protein